jgi:Rps23 Pro-64 3,4-dihydroxylase Tpa1-like proline 4-hydroxylase
LSADWSQADGGDLCLFDSDPAKNHPTQVAKRIQPLENTFSLFRVQNNSWHSVEEVLVSEGGVGKQRLSLNGWFHYPENAAIPLGPGPAPEEPLTRVKPSMDITVYI